MPIPNGYKEDGTKCPSCLLPYNNKERTPKVRVTQTWDFCEIWVNTILSYQILSCYHTYCASCLELYMFKDGLVTCLGCGRITQADRWAEFHQKTLFWGMEWLQIIFQYKQSYWPMCNCIYKDWMKGGYQLCMYLYTVCLWCFFSHTKLKNYSTLML